MSKITVDEKGFSNIVIAYLFDMIQNPDKIKDNENFYFLIQELKGRGFKVTFMQYYLEMSSSFRVMYKRMISDQKTNQRTVINVERIKKNESNIVKHSISKLLKRESLAKSKTLNEEEFASLTEFLYEDVQ